MRNFVSLRAIFLYCLAGLLLLWGVPLVAPRGVIWGHYRLIDVMIGMPVAFGLLFSGALLATPSPKRLKGAIFILALAFWVGFSALAFDVMYTLFVVGAWQPNFWLDRAHISRRYSQADPELGFIRKPLVSWHGSFEGSPSFYRTDENGFRNPPGQRQADVVFIGDSYTEAASVPEPLTFVGRAAAASGLRAANLGRAAYGPQQELIVLKRYALQYKPRFIVWQVFPGNDLSDAYQFVRWKSGPERHASILRRYFNSSLLRRAALTATGLPQSDLTPAEIVQADGSVQPLMLRYRPHAPEEARTGIAELRRVLAEAQEICRANDIQLGVMVVPIMMRVMQPYLRVAGADVSDRRLTFFLEEYVTGWCAEIGCSYIDLLGPMIEEARRGNRNLYIPNDEHLAVAGHEVTARTIVRWLNGRTRLAASRTPE